MTPPLMPKATAMWLINNTALTFEQIAEFCALHPLEVKAMADETHPERIIPRDPVMTGQLTQSEIEAAEKDPRKRLVMAKARYDVPPEKKGRSRQRYTPVSRRQDRPDAIYWLLRNHPELSDPEISKLIGTTKSTIESIRNRSHWNSANIKPVDPVTLGLCEQLELDLAVQRASGNKARAGAPGAKLKPAQDSVKEAHAAAENPEMKYDPASIFSSMQKYKSK